jgi:hypothetical protein
MTPEQDTHFRAITKTAFADSLGLQFAMLSPATLAAYQNVEEMVIRTIDPIISALGPGGAMPINVVNDLMLACSFASDILTQIGDECQSAILAKAGISADAFERMTKQ